MDPKRGQVAVVFALTDDSRMIVANNLSDAVTIFDINTRGELRASGQVTVRRSSRSMRDETALL